MKDLKSEYGLKTRSYVVNVLVNVNVFVTEVNVMLDHEKPDVYKVSIDF